MHMLGNTYIYHNTHKNTYTRIYTYTAALQYPEVRRILSDQNNVQTLIDAGIDVTKLQGGHVTDAPEDGDGFDDEEGYTQ